MVGSLSLRLKDHRLVASDLGQGSADRDSFERALEGHYVGRQAGAELGMVEAERAKGEQEDVAAYAAAQEAGGTEECLVSTTEGFAYVGVQWEGQWVPEARSYRQVVLPHLLPAMAAMFPVAKACSGAGGEDLEFEPCELEERGLAIGRGIDVVLQGSSGDPLGFPGDQAGAIESPSRAP